MSSVKTRLRKGMLLSVDYEETVKLTLEVPGFIKMLVPGVCHHLPAFYTLKYSGTIILIVAGGFFERRNLGFGS